MDRTRVGRGRRGLFFTLDALFAIIAVGAITFLIFQQLPSGSETFSESNLNLLADGTMASLDKGGFLVGSVSNSSAVPSAMSIAPAALCWQVDLVREDGATLSSAKRAGCLCSAGRSVFSRRAVVFRNSTSAVFAIGQGRFCFQ